MRCPPLAIWILSLLMLQVEALTSNVQLTTTTVSAASTHATTPMAPVTAPLPFMLFGSDLVKELEFREPVCVFATSVSSNNNSKIAFTGINSNGTMGAPISMVLFLRKVNTSEVVSNIFALFGMHCFEDAEDRVQITYGDLFSGLNVTSIRWQSVIFYFMAKEKVFGACANKGMFNLGGNVFGPACSQAATESEWSWPCQIHSLTVHKDCPAVFLSPTGIVSSCPNSKFIYSKALPRNLRLDVSTVRSGVRNIADLSMFSLTADNVQSYDYANFARSVFSVESNASEWHNDVLGVSNTDNTNGHPCMLARSQIAKNNVIYRGYVDLDPLHFGEVGYEMRVVQLNLKDDPLRLDIKPYDGDCISLDVKLGGLAGESEVKRHNPVGRLNLTIPVNMYGAYFTFILSRKNVTKCDLKTAKLWFSVENSVKPTTTKVPTSTLRSTITSSNSQTSSPQTDLPTTAIVTTTTMTASTESITLPGSTSAGPKTTILSSSTSTMAPSTSTLRSTTSTHTTTPMAPVTAPLPFMLFGSDLVKELDFREPVCVFATSVSSNNNSKIAFTGINSNGTMGAPISMVLFLRKVNTSEDVSNIFALFGMHCFEDAEDRVQITYGDLFSGLNVTSIRWQSVIFYFMAKEKVFGACANKGMFNLGGNVFGPACSQAATESEWSWPCQIHSLTVHKDCPAVFLSPTGIVSSCPNSKFIYSKPLPRNLRLDVSTVRSGVRNIADLSMFSLTADTVQSYDYANFARSVFSVESNASEWHNDVLGVSNTDNTNGDPCLLGRLEVTKPNVIYRGYVDLDPFHFGVVAYEVRLVQRDLKDLLNLDIKSYDVDCISIDLEFGIIGGDIKFQQHNPVGRLNLTIPVDSYGAYFAFAISRENVTKCDLKTVKLWYSVEDSVNPSTTQGSTITSSSSQTSSPPTALPTTAIVTTTTMTAPTESITLPGSTSASPITTILSSPSTSSTSTMAPSTSTLRSTTLSPTTREATATVSTSAGPMVTPNRTTVSPSPSTSASLTTTTRSTLIASSSTARTTTVAPSTAPQSPTTSNASPVPTSVAHTTLPPTLSATPQRGSSRRHRLQQTLIGILILVLLL